MRIPRIFVPDALASDTETTLPDQAAHHVRNVLRLQIGAELILFNGRGGEYEARLSTVAKRNLTVTVGAHRARSCESNLIIEIGLGIAKGDRMDYAIQKATELGVNRITPLATERSVVALSGERSEKKWDHWHAVIVSACEQSGRNDLPQLGKPQGLTEWCDRVEAQTKFVLSPTATVSFRQHKAPIGSVALAIGPEGGLSDTEVAQTQRFGFTPTQLGPRILRVETATVAAIGALQTLWGDF